MKKFIKLINDERSTIKIASQKAASCETGSYDYCHYNVDNSPCTANAYDYCGKDHTSCREYAYDYCLYVDDDRPCSGQGASDICFGTQDIAYDEKE